MTKKILTILGGCILAFNLFTLTGFAKEQPKTTPYYVKPILPSNQDRGITNYISVSATDKLKQEFEFLVTNKTKHPITIKIKPVNALTSPKGVIDYTKSIEEKNYKLIDKKYSFANYVDVVNQLELSSGQSKVVKAKVNVNKINGTILGGLQFQAIVDGKTKINGETKRDGSLFKIKNKINTTIGVQINFPTKDIPRFKVGNPFIDPMPAFYAIRLPLTLKTPHLQKDVSLKYTVWDYNGKKIFGSEIDNLYSFAPKTKANIALPWEAKTIKKNKTYKIKGTIDYGSEKLKFEKDFTFKGKDIETNGTFLNVPNELGQSFWWLLLLLPLLALLILFKKKRYVLLSNELALAIIEENHELYEKVIPVKEKAQNHTNLYEHYYIKKKTKNNKSKNGSSIEVSYYYKFIKTKQNKNLKQEHPNES